MNIIYNLKLIYKVLNEYKYSLFCNPVCYKEPLKECCDACCKYDCDNNDNCNNTCIKGCCDTCCKHDCYKKDNCNKICEMEDEILLRNIACEFLQDNFCTKVFYKWEFGCEEENCSNLIDLLLKIFTDIEESCHCNKNYGFLLQIDKLKCILENLRNLLRQLKCLKVKDCSLISKALCALYKIIELLADIISKINNIECLCESSLSCKCEIINSMVCELEDEVNCLEEIVAQLSCIVFEIASKNIINCTKTECYKPKKKNYCNKYYK